MKKIAFSITMCLGLLGSAASFAKAPAWVEFDEINYGGTGCPQGTVSTIIAQDRKAFTVLLDEFIAEIGPDIPRKENRKFCQLTASLRYPAGWQFALMSFDYRGYVSLDKGVKGLQQTFYYFSGESNTKKFETPISGPIDDDYQSRDYVSNQDYLTWSPCHNNRDLNIKSVVRLTTKNRNKTGIMTLDSIDGSVQHTYGLVWRQCH